MPSVTSVGVSVAPINPRATERLLRASVDSRAALGDYRPMYRLVRLLGHGAGLAGVIIAIGSLLRFVPAGLLRFLPYTHDLTQAGIGGPLSIALLGLAALILGGDGGNS